MNLGSEILPASKAAKTRYIWTDSHGLVPVPSGLGDAMKTVPPLTSPLYKAALKELFVKRGPAADESVYEFFHRRFGNEVQQNIRNSIVLVLKITFCTTVDY